VTIGLLFILQKNVLNVIKSQFLTQQLYPVLIVIMLSVRDVSAKNLQPGKKKHLN
jgi:hypothetical protein